ncbi:MAG: Uma2 family endonuclease [Rubrobacteraceae bacterium]
MAEALKSPPEGRVTLRNVGWETFERLVEEDPGRSAPRFFYDRGELEIVSPSFEHQQITRIIAILVEELSVELDIDVVSAGATTFKREDLLRGFEPDACFYFFGNIPRVRGKRRLSLDAGDPPPNLVVEVDITSPSTSPSTSKLPIYSRLGVAEVWRHDGDRLMILGASQWNAGEVRYTEISESAIFAPARVSGKSLTHFVEQGLASHRPAWTRMVREWARKLRRTS